jgi:N-acetylmuramoyl-L-alanine amidase
MYRDLTETGAVKAGEEVLQELGGIGKLHRSEIQQAGFMVLKSPDVPSILVETAFISNPTDEKNLRSSAHQQKLADAILKGVVNYFNKAPPEGTLLAQKGPQRLRGPAGGPQQHVIARGDTLSGIAYRYNVSLRNLRSANGLRNDRIRVGQVLRIPTT